MYFKNFPLIYCVFEINGERVLKTVKDITLNVRIRKAVLDSVTLYDEYDIQDGETPELISHKIYGSSYYHWVVMLCNQRYDYTEDFPLSQNQLDLYCYRKYGKCTFQDTGDTVTIANHGLVNGETVSFSYIETTTGIEPYTLYYVINRTTNTFQVSDAPSGGVKTLQNNGIGNIIEFAYKPHHYVNSAGYIVSSDQAGATPVTNFDYEVGINEEKRRIKLISPALLNTIVNQFKELI